MSEATFTWAGVRRGAVEGLAFTASSIVYGIGFGVVAAAAGLSLIEAAAMSLFVFSGTAQFGVVQAWGTGLGFVGVFATVLATNVRYILMGAALRPWLGSLKARFTIPTLFLLVDGSFARGMAQRAKGQNDAGVLLGTSAGSWIAWVLGTIAGFLLGRAVGDPRRFGLDFVVVAFCASALALLWRGRGDLYPIGAALIAAVTADRIAGGSWAVVAAALAATLVGALRFRPETSE